jgi:hypothetical protein
VIEVLQDRESHTATIKLRHACKHAGPMVKGIGLTWVFAVAEKPQKPAMLPRPT